MALTPIVLNDESPLCVMMDDFPLSSIITSFGSLLIETGLMASQGSIQQQA